MRITAGNFKGRSLIVAKGRVTRPTADRTRQALFNILDHGIAGFSLTGTRVIDLFAGSGALGLEALSRGAAHCTFVERDRTARQALSGNIDALGLADRAAIMSMDATRLPKAETPVGLAFLDPPYGKGLIAPAFGSLRDRGWLDAGALCVIETAADEIPDLPDGFSDIDHRVYGAARIGFARFS